jgi:hypothetical protein
MIVHDLLTQNLIANTVCGLLNGGASINFLNVTNLIVATIPFEATAFAPAVNSQAVAVNFPKSAPALISDTIVSFQIVDATAVVKITGSVTIEGGGGDIELVGITYSAGDILILNSLIYRVPN